MAATAQNIMEYVLEKGGYIQGGKWSSGLIDAEKAKSSATTDLRYGQLFDKSGKNGSIIDLVYEVPNQASDLPGTPSIYFKILEEPSAETIKNLRSLIWNQGHAPTLWIVTPTSVLIYDSYARPQKDDNEKSHLLEELKQIGGQIQFYDEFYKKNFDTGDFWQSKYGKGINKQQRVDAAMLSDLTSTEDVLISELTRSKPELPPSASVSIAHALLGRAIFVSYLVDRGLLDALFFQREYYCTSFPDLLDNQKATYAFFGWLRKTFNGDLFPFQKDEQKSVEQTNALRIVKEFLLGTDMNSYSKSDYISQRRFWPYKFDFIPVELISSIYEKFAHSRDSSAAEANSIHYTRLPLVELVLSLAMKDIPHTAKVLDPACGSGIFLVEAFRRLVWTREKVYGKPVRRDELHEMLRSQIFGIDIDRDAIHVTAFSLYLTLLELDPDPQPLEALKFPALLSADPSFNQLPNLYIQDFCNTEHIFNRTKPFVSKEFDLIVGNPPWTALKKVDAPRDPDNPQFGHQWSLEYCKKKDIPGNKPDQAFITRVRDFAHLGTRIALVVCSRIFYQQKDTSWLDTFLSTSTIEIVVNLSDLVGENILFGGNSSTRLPASAILFRISDPTENKVMYITPKWYPGVSKRDEIIIASEDIHYLAQKLLQEKPFLWKSAFRGTTRDYKLLSRLQELPSVESVLSIAGVSELAHRGISFGNIEQKPTPYALQGKPFLASTSAKRYRIDITNLGLLNRSTIAAKSNTKFLDLPALIIPRSLADGNLFIALAESSNDRHQLVIDHMYYGIPSSVSFPSLIYRMNAILNSKMAFYIAFMFSSALGWDRRLIEVGDWKQVYLPSSILNNDSKEIWSDILHLEHWLRIHWQSDPEPKLAREIALQQDILEKAIFQLYELTEQEIIQVEDMLQYTIKPFLHRKKKLNTLDAFAKPDLNDLQTYARRMCLQLNGILHYCGLELTATVIKFEHSSTLCACHFTQKALGQNHTITTAYLNDTEDILKQIEDGVRFEVADHLYVQRSLRIYENDGFWIIKGAWKRLWSESSALNDADTVVYEHMEAMID